MFFLFSTGIDVTWSSISIATDLVPESIDWIANGLVVATGPHVDLLDPPSGLLYLRAVVSDGGGRTVYTQPFALTVPEPPGDASLLLGSAALAAAAVVRRRRKRIRA